MRGLCTVVAVWLGLLAGLAAVQHHPGAPPAPDHATTSIKEK